MARSAASRSASVTPIRQSAPPGRESRRAVAAAAVGNLLEWYDFAIYAYMAVVIARKFFPAGDELTSLLAAFAAFGIGFVARPLGGIVIGRLGDARGRKSAMLVTLALMTVGTVLIGVTPEYAQIGPAAPMLIVAARLMQGFSAGGEWGTSTAFIVEWAPQGRRGLYGSLQQCSVAAGLLLGASIAAATSTFFTLEQVDAWAWRIPFLLGATLGPVGLYMRRHVEETPAYLLARIPAQQEKEEPPATLAARAFGFTILWSVAYYTGLAYLPTFLQQHAGFPRTQALWSTAAGLLVMVVATPALGALSDRVGRKPLLIAACAVFVVLPYPLFRFLLSQPSFAEVLLAQCLLAAAIATFSGPGPAAIAEIFPTRLRSGWMSIGYTLSVALFGGFAPYLATWLIARTGNPLAPSFYLIAAALVTLGVILNLRETAQEALR
jgi:MFS transporter, MHS family, proline/betaine transporter